MNEYLKKLSEIIHSQYIKRYELDGTLQVAASLISLCGYHAYIYGAGKDVDLFIQYFEMDKIKFKGIIDSDSKKQGAYIRGVKIISLEEFLAKNDKNAYVFIYSLIQQKSVDEKEVLSLLHKAEVIDYCFIGNIRYSIVACLPCAAMFNEERRLYYERKEVEIGKFLTNLDDDESRKILLEYIRTFMECSVYKLEHLPTIWKYFYGKGGQELYCHSDEEIWINFGANVGDTIFLYLKNGLKAKKIYAIEGDKEIAKQLRYNLQFLQKQLRDKITVIRHYVKKDGYFSDFFESKTDEKISLINCDIEGSELEMLHQMKTVIQKCRPVLAICVYHKKEDIIEIPKFINSIVNNYFFKLRKYTPWCGDVKENQELVLYAIPKERKIYSGY